MSKHTPGPYKADTVSANTGDIGVSALDGRIVVASVHNGASAISLLRDGTAETQWANARLIAAAPTMRSYIETRAALGDAEAAKILEAIDGNAGPHTAEHSTGRAQTEYAKRTQAVIAEYRETVKHLRAVNAEMLEALRKAAAYIKDDIGQSGARMDYSDTDALNAINAAIAKAEGLQP